MPKKPSHRNAPPKNATDEPSPPKDLTDLAREAPQPGPPPSGFSFRFTKTAAAVIRAELGQAMLTTDSDWAAILTDITDIARSALTRAANHASPPYASQAAEDVRELANELRAVATRYDALGPDLQALIQESFDAAGEECPLLRHVPSERSAMRKLLTAVRLTPFLQGVARAAELVAGPLETAGEVLPVSSLPAQIDGLSEEDTRRVQTAVTNAASAKRRPFGGRLPYTGRPGKGEAVRWAVLELMSLYWKVTTTQPKMSRDNYNDALDGYIGTFYPFVKAVLAPLQLMAKEETALASREMMTEAEAESLEKSLPGSIFKAYKKHNKEVGRVLQPRHPEKDKKSPP